MLVKRLIIALALAAVSAPASADGASCVISTTPLAFGRYVPSRNAPVDFTATLTLACVATGEGSASIEGTISLMDSGGGCQLAAGRHRLRYQLFADPARTIPWRDGPGAKAVSGGCRPGESVARQLHHLRANPCAAARCPGRKL